MRGEAGTWVRVHSAYDPEREAAAFLDRTFASTPIPPAVAVIGVGLGYVVDELVRRRPDVHLVVLELVPELVELRQRRNDWKTLAESGQLVAGAAPAYSLGTTVWPPRALSEPPAILVHPVLGKHFPAALERARSALAQFLFEQRANAEARERLAWLFLQHTLQNLPILEHAADVSGLDAIAAGNPVVLCGAGPSLDGAMPALRSFRDRVWLVALDTAVRTLVHGGVIPDVVVAIDPTPLNGRHLINLPTRARPWLVADASVDPRALTAFAGRLFACTISEADPWPWLRRQGVTPTKLRAWGSVLTAACDLVSRMRGSTTIFAGLDLAFTNGQPYCRGTAFEEDWRAQQMRDGLASIQDVWEARISEDAVEEPDLTGRPSRTTGHMIAFRNWVRALAASSPEREFINVTGAGILHGSHIRQATLAEVLTARPAIPDVESRLDAAAGGTPFSQGFETVRAQLAASSESTDPLSMEPVRTWSAVVPRFDPTAAGLLIRRARARLGIARKGHAMRTTTEWIDVTYDPSCFWAKAPLRWRVDADNVATFAYRMDGKTMTLAVTIENSIIALEANATVPSNEIYVRIPDNYLPARGTAHPVWMGGVASRECGYARVHPGHDYVVFFRGSEDRFPLDPGHFCVFGQLTFEVQ